MRRLRALPTSRSGAGALPHWFVERILGQQLTASGTHPHTPAHAKTLLQVSLHMAALSLRLLHHMQTGLAQLLDPILKLYRSGTGHTPALHTQRPSVKARHAIWLSSVRRKAPCCLHTALQYTLQYSCMYVWEKPCSVV